MRLTRHTDYALRILLYLAAKPDAVATVGEVARTFDVSQNHLAKIAQRLGQLGYLELLRGQAGGMRLRSAPGTIKVGEVVCAIEKRWDLLECFDPAINTCPIDGQCALKGVFKTALRRFLDELDRFTLADMVRSPTLLTQLARPNDARLSRVGPGTSDRARSSSR